MKKWVSIVFSLHLLMASSASFAVAQQYVSAREGVKTGTKAAASTSAGARAGSSSAKLSTDGVNLTQKLASEAQMSQAGRIIMRDLHSGPRLAQQYGGKATDWVKKTSSPFSKNGKMFETHWYENLSTGQRVEFKTKLIQGW